MSSISDHMSIAHRYARSANLERDSQSQHALDGYLLTGRAVDLVDRIASTVRSGSGGAWSVTGPYGSGKSSFGVFLDALYGPRKSRAFRSALAAVSDLSPDLAEAIRASRGSDIAGVGFARALVTAKAEPVTVTIARALEHAADGWFEGRPTARQFPEVKLLKAALDDATSLDPRRTGPAPGSLVEVAVALARRAPLLLVIDEFGKNLEAAQQRNDADLYLLQLIAEASQTATGAPILLVTMQHLAFNEYAAAADTMQQREWAKIQGRFEDVTFVDSPSQTRQLVSAVFEHDAKLDKLVRAWATERGRQMADAQLFDVSDPKLIAGCYPIDPLALAVLPELCSRYGQNERTLFSFLAGSEPNAIPRLLESFKLSTPLPTVGLPAVYDYFASSPGSAAHGGTSRWAEITLRLRDAARLDANTLAAAKSVAVLNLVATNGPLRASSAVLAVAGASACLPELERLGLVTHRESADEYRIWQGSGLDLAELTARASKEISAWSNLRLLREAAPLEPMVATGHALRTDTLRTFRRDYADDIAQLAALGPGSDFDGTAYVLTTLAAGGLPPAAPAGLPVVVQVADSLEAVLELAREVCALVMVLGDPAVATDWVARLELTERLSVGRQRLADELEAIGSSSDWFLLSDAGPQRLRSIGGTSALSDACDRAFSSTVLVRNETLNRVDISSQGARARRELLLAMLNSESLENLGLEGTGPEVAMYNALLRQPGVHTYDKRHDRFVLRAPAKGRLRDAWGVVEAELRRATDRRVSLSDVHAALQLPPIGMKAGPIPVLVLAVLVSLSDEVAVYEHGTFRPMITEAICDRMVRNPGHFEVKHFANASGARSHVVEALAASFGLAPRFSKHRVGNVLAVVTELVSQIGTLPPLTMRATELSDPALAVREAVSRAVEPDELLFGSLPSALGFGKIGPRLPRWRHTTDFVNQLASALSELTQHYGEMRAGLIGEVLNRSRESTRSRLSTQAKVLEGEVIDPDTRSFVIALAADTFDDERWIENLATGLTRKAPPAWTESDRRQFTVELVGRLAAFRRLLLLHSELRRSEDGAIEAFRLTLTASTGREAATLVAVDNEMRAVVEPVLEQAIEQLIAHCGSQERALDMLLAVAVDRVLPHAAAAVGNTEKPLKRAKVVAS
jgi:hypothetical protein